jgi:hypothetical protein
LLAARANPAFDSTVEPALAEADGPLHVGRFQFTRFCRG